MKKNCFIFITVVCLSFILLAGCSQNPDKTNLDTQTTTNQDDTVIGKDSNAYAGADGQTTFAQQAGNLAIDDEGHFYMKEDVPENITVNDVPTKSQNPYPFMLIALGVVFLGGGITFFLLRRNGITIQDLHIKETFESTIGEENINKVKQGIGKIINEDQLQKAKNNVSKVVSEESMNKIKGKIDDLSAQVKHQWDKRK